MEGSHHALFTSSTQYMGDVSQGQQTPSEPPHRHPAHRYSRDEIMSLGPNRLSDFGEKPIDFFDTDSSDVDEPEGVASHKKMKIRPLQQDGVREYPPENKAASLRVDTSADGAIQHEELPKPHELKHISQRLPVAALVSASVCAEKDQKRDSHLSIGKTVTVPEEALCRLLRQQAKASPTLAERREERILSLHNLTLRAMLQTEIAEARSFSDQHDHASTPGSLGIGSKPSPLHPRSRLALQAREAEASTTIATWPLATSPPSNAKSKKTVTLPPALAKTGRWGSSPQIVRTPFPFPSGTDAAPGLSGPSTQFSTASPTSVGLWSLRGSPGDCPQNPRVVLHLRFTGLRRGRDAPDPSGDQLDVRAYRGGGAGVAVHVAVYDVDLSYLHADDAAERMTDANLWAWLRAQYDAYVWPRRDWRRWWNGRLCARRLRVAFDMQLAAQAVQWALLAQTAPDVDLASRALTRRFRDADGVSNVDEHRYVAVALAMARCEPSLVVRFEHGWHWLRVAVAGALALAPGLAVLLVWVFLGPGAGRAAGEQGRVGLGLVLGMLTWGVGAACWAAWLLLSWYAW